MISSLLEQIWFLVCPPPPKKKEEKKEEEKKHPHFLSGLAKKRGNRDFSQMATKLNM